MLISFGTGKGDYSIQEFLEQRKFSVAYNVPLSFKENNIHIYKNDDYIFAILYKSQHKSNKSTKHNGIKAKKLIREHLFHVFYNNKKYKNKKVATKTWNKLSPLIPELMKGIEFINIKNDEIEAIYSLSLSNKKEVVENLIHSQIFINKYNNFLYDQAKSYYKNSQFDLYVEHISQTYEHSDMPNELIFCLIDSLLRLNLKKEAEKEIKAMYYNSDTFSLEESEVLIDFLLMVNMTKEANEIEQKIFQLFEMSKKK